MAHCPVCNTRSETHWLRGFVVGLFLALLVGFISGQLFHSWKYDYKTVVQNLQERNKELREGYVPPRSK